MDLELPEILALAIIVCLGFVVLAAITRAIFAIGTFLKVQRAALQILLELAKQQGVDQEKLKEINTYANS